MYIAIQKREQGENKIAKNKNKDFLFDSIDELLQCLLEDRIYYLSGYCNKNYEKIQEFLDGYVFYKVEEQIEGIDINNYPIIKENIVNKIKDSLKRDKEDYKSALKNIIEENQKELDRINNEEF